MSNTENHASERRRIRKKKNRRYLISQILVGLVVLVLVVGIISSFGGNVKTYVAETGTIENSISANGYIFRNQSLINADGGTYADFEVSEGQRVTEGTEIAGLYSSEVDPAVCEQVRELRTQIKELEDESVIHDVFANNAVKVEQRISSDVRQYSGVRKNSNMSDISQTKRDVDALIEKKLSISGAGQSEEEVLNSLKSQMSALENQLESSRTAVIAPSAGVFSSRIDGMEAALSFKALENLSVDYLSQLDSMKPVLKQTVVEGEPFCKIVDNYAWYFVAAIPEKELEDIAVGDVVSLRFYDFSDVSATATVMEISPVKSGKAAVSFYSREYVDSIYSTSVAPAEILTASYKGIKVPSSALRVVSEQQGVYVLRLGVAHFVPVTVKYNDKKWAIVSSDTSVQSDYYLQIYDEVVVESKNIEEGKVVR